MKWFGAKENAAETVEDVVVAKARACLSLEEFKDYREAYEKEERDIIGALLIDAGSFAMKDGATLEKFGANCLVRLNRLRDVRGLLRDVTVNANRGGKK